MIPSINIFNIPEITNIVFSEVGLRENISTVMLVCSLWRSHAIYPIKQQLILKPEEELRKKMLHFLVMTGKTVRDYCPVFEEAEKDLNEYRVKKETFEKLNNLTEKHEVSFATSFIVDTASYTAHLDTLEQNLLPDASSAEKSLVTTMKNRKEAISGKTFITLTFKSVDSDEGTLFTWDQWKYNHSSFFPIELFDLKLGEKIETTYKLTGEKIETTYKLTGEKNKGTCCFDLNGKLIELIIIPQKHPFYKHRKEITTSIVPFNRSTDIALATNYYIPHLDEKKRTEK